MQQNETLTFALRKYPVLVVIVDAIGEATTKVVKTTIKVKAPVAPAAPAADAAPANDARRLSAEEFDNMIEDVLLFEEINIGF